MPKKMEKEIVQHNDKPCPHCGYCPTCGRGPNPIYVRPYPYTPWPNYPTITWWFNTAGNYETGNTIRVTNAAGGNALAS